MTIAMAIALVASYLLGAVPTSFIVAKLFRGIDLREHGSKNLGATNVYRTLGARFAIPVGLLDMLKGVVPVLVFAPLASSSKLFALMAGIAAVVGHVFSVFVNFRGGKGVATAAGVMAAFTPLAVLGSIVIWTLLVRATGYVSLGSIVSAAALPALAWWWHPEDRDIIWVQAIVAAAIVVLHRANIRRLLQGNENRFGARRSRGALP